MTLGRRCILHNIHYAKWAADPRGAVCRLCMAMAAAVVFVIRQFCPVEVEILVREADIVGPP